MKLYMLYIFLIVFFSFQVYDSHGVENDTLGKKFYDDDKVLVKVLESYWKWWSNTPEDHPDMFDTPKPICSMHTDSQYFFIFLQDSFDTGENLYDCREEPISKGYSILFPLITSFCSQGDNGLVGKPYEEIRDCTLNLNRGTIQANVLLDNKEIVNIFIDNGNGLDILSNQKIVDRLPQFQYYKKIYSEDFVGITATNKTIHKLNWANPSEFANHAVVYNGIIYCDCIIIDTEKLDLGNHELEYRISAVAKPPSPNLASEGWQFKSTTNYKFTIQ